MCKFFKGEFKINKVVFSSESGHCLETIRQLPNQDDKSTQFSITH